MIYANVITDIMIFAPLSEIAIAKAAVTLKNIVQLVATVERISEATMAIRAAKKALDVSKALHEMAVVGRGLRAVEWVAGIGVQGGRASRIFAGARQMYLTNTLLHHAEQFAGERFGKIGKEITHILGGGFPIGLTNGLSGNLRALHELERAATFARAAAKLGHMFGVPVSQMLLNELAVPKFLEWTGADKDGKAKWVAEFMINNVLPSLVGEAQGHFQMRKASKETGVALVESTHGTLPKVELERVLPKSQGDRRLNTRLRARHISHEVTLL